MQSTRLKEVLIGHLDSLGGRVEKFKSDVKDEMLLNRRDVQEHGSNKCVDHEPRCWNQKLCEQINCGCVIDYIITGIQ